MPAHGPRDSPIIKHFPGSPKLSIATVGGYRGRYKSINYTTVITEIRLEQPKSIPCNFFLSNLIIVIDVLIEGISPTISALRLDGRLTIFLHIIETFACSYSSVPCCLGKSSQPGLFPFIFLVPCLQSVSREQNLFLAGCTTDWHLVGSLVQLGLLSGISIRNGRLKSINVSQRLGTV